MTFSYEPAPSILSSPEAVEGVFCAECGKLIELGEVAVELFVGEIGRGGKSGQLMVVDYKVSPYTPETVHIWCAQDWIENNIWELGVEPNDSPKLCDGCGTKLDEKILGDE